MKNELIEKLNNQKDRSAWAKGVNAYACWMLEDVSDEDLTIAVNNSKLEALLLNGARSWKEASWSGCFLCYDADIANALCAPWELKKTKNGQLRPNKREEWLDVQARALFQAYYLIKRLVWELK